MSRKVREIKDWLDDSSQVRVKISVKEKKSTTEVTEFRFMISSLRLCTYFVYSETLVTKGLAIEMEVIEA